MVSSDCDTHTHTHTHTEKDVRAAEVPSFNKQTPGTHGAAQLYVCVYSGVFLFVCMCEHTLAHICHPPVPQQGFHVSRHSYSVRGEAGSFGTIYAV